MESPNAPPAHDFFTPAWLKLPDPQLTKKTSSVSPSQSCETQSRRFSNSSRKESTNSTNSLTNGSDICRFNNSHDSSHYLSSRHNSFGSEQTIGNVNGRPSKSAEATRSPFRTYRDKQFAGHSIPKHKNADTFKTNFTMSSKKSNKSSELGLDNVQNVTNEENCNVFNQEFPSLVKTNGEQSGANDNSNVQNPWTNPSTKSKVLSTSKNMQLIHSTVNHFDNGDGSNKSEAKMMVPSGKYRNMSLIGKKPGILKENAVYSRIQPMLTKTTAQTSSPSMEILVKNPKKKSNKEFLKSIQNDQNKDKGSDQDINHFGEKLDKLEITANNRKIEEMSSKTRISGYENDLNNALNINNFLHRSTEQMSDAVLSSSLEAEHRLLMELGWKADLDEDDPSYAPLTEDEVKEFYARKNLKDLTAQRKMIHIIEKQDFADKRRDASTVSEDESSSSSDDD